MPSTPCGCAGKKNEILYLKQHSQLRRLTKIKLCNLYLYGTYIPKGYVWQINGIIVYYNKSSGGKEKAAELGKQTPMSGNTHFE